MLALRYDTFGPPGVLRVADVAEPVPAAGQLKIRVAAASLNPLDWKIRAGHLRLVPMLDRPPRGTGCDFAGEVVGVGGGTMGFYPGQRVFGSLPPMKRQGAVAAFVCADATAVAPIPEGIGFAAAAALPIAAGTAVQALVDHAQLGMGQQILITAAAGGVGHFAVQLAKFLGARVTAVCGTANVEFARSLGADDVIDYSHADFTRAGGRFDVIFDIAGAAGYFASRAVLAPQGLYIDTAASAGAMVRTAVAGAILRLGSGQRAIALVLRANGALWQRLARYAADGVLTPAIEHRIAPDQVVAAQAAMETSHGRGKWVVDMSLGTAG